MVLNGTFNTTWYSEYLYVKCLKYCINICTNWYSHCHVLLIDHYNILKSRRISAGWFFLSCRLHHKNILNWFYVYWKIELKIRNVAIKNVMKYPWFMAMYGGCHRASNLEFRVKYYHAIYYLSKQTKTSCPWKQINSFLVYENEEEYF